MQPDFATLKLADQQPDFGSLRLVGGPSPAMATAGAGIPAATPINWSTSTFPGAPTGQAIGTLAGYGISRIKDLINGTNESRFYDLSAPSPTQVGGDVARSAGIIGGLMAAPATIPGAIIAGATSGALQAGGTTAVNKGNANDIISSSLLGGGIGGVTAGVFAGFGKLLGNLGDKIMISEVKPSKADIEDGFSLGTIKKYNLGGTLHQMQSKTQSALSNLTRQLNDRLGAYGARTSINLDDAVSATERDLSSSRGTLGNFGMNTKVGGAIDQLKSEIFALGRPDVSIPDAQVIKQAAGGFGAWSYGRLDPEAKASEVVYNSFYRNLKTMIERVSPEGVRNINAEISKLIPIQNAILRRIPVASRNAAISLTDMIGLAASTMHPAALGLTLTNFLSKSGIVGNALSKVGPRFTTLGGGIGGFSGQAAASKTSLSQ